jgi:hypothetical protein
MGGGNWVVGAVRDEADSGNKPDGAFFSGANFGRHYDWATRSGGPELTANYCAEESNARSLEDETLSVGRITDTYLLLREQGRVRTVAGSLLFYDNWSIDD